MIDLHSHTLHSDGQRSPAELLAEAADRGLTVLALTDHDTVSGIADAMEAARSHGVRLVPGIELSCELHGREVHVLGHFLDPLSKGVLRLAEQMLAERWQRMERMVERARTAGFAGVTMELVIAASGGENLGRPHLARVLVDCGHCKSVKDAFDRYLGNGGPFFVDRLRLSVQQAAELIRAAGGTSSLAHPGANTVSRQELKTCAGLGLDAVEAFHPEHVPNQAEAYQRWAGEFGLLVTAGSDYHGPAVQPDRKLGDRTLSLDRFAALEERSRRP
ncbi:MAG: PHP domain-containing protein [Deltaproteobacteria bacterium]|nr:MAG: PHP domain-containing protein [Deltaproteobacteria bacterium]TMB30876.1 MAG: PHP domain-containing protein [Deltaproteobacteria bacterium]